VFSPLFLADRVGVQDCSSGHPLLGEDSFVNALFIGQPDEDDRLGDFIETNLNDRRWTSFHAAIAFVKQGGVKHVETSLRNFAQRAEVKLSIGINFGGTSIEGLSRLFEAVGNRGEIWIFHNGNGSTFHPKVYLFKNDNEAEIAIGSGNLTEGGLYTNYEASFVSKLNAAIDSENKILHQVEKTLDRWRHGDAGLARLLDDDLLDQLAARGYLPPEVYSRETEEAGSAGDGSSEEWEDPLFATVAVKAAPPRKPSSRPDSRAGVGAATGPTTFYITLQRTDVGRGQVKPGTHARSPEIYIPLTARNAAPAFWDWPAAFTPDTTKPGKMDLSVR